jgi:hypothetical protein
LDDNISGGAFSESTPVIEPLPSKPASWRKLRGVPQSPRSRQKSAISNGKLTLEGDGRSAWHRRARDLFSDFCSDLSGEGNCSASELAIIKRVCFLICCAEQRESKWSQAGQVSDIELMAYNTTVNTIGRLLKLVGLKRRAKVVKPLDDLIAELDQNGDDNEQ